MTPEQYAALRLALIALGVDLPVDITDPRVTPAALAEWKATLAAKYTELRPGANLVQLKLLRDGENAIKGEEANRAELARIDEERAAEAAAAQAATDAKAIEDAKTDEERAAEAKAAEDAAKAAEEAAAAAAVEPPKGTPGAATVVMGLGVNTVPPADPEGKIELAKVASLQAAALKDGAGSTERPKATWRTASATVGDGNYGAPLVHVGNMGKAIADHAVACGRATDQEVRFGDGKGKVVVASVPALEYEPGIDTDGMLTRLHTADQNTEIIKLHLAEHGKRLVAAKEGRVHTAAAPWCEPFDIIRTIPDCTEQSTPFRDSLPFIPMGHGGFQFNTGVSLADLSGSVDIWTPEDQAAINPNDVDTWKRCLMLECPGDPPTIALDDWVTACLEWQIGTDLNNPERVRDYFIKLETLRARVTEQWLLSMVDVLTINYGNDDVSLNFWGGLNDLIRIVLMAFVTSNYDERNADDAGYTLYLDTGVMETLQAGEILSAHAKTNGTRAGIISYIMERLEMVQAVVVLRDRVPGQYGTVGANGNPRSANAAVGGGVVDVPGFVHAGIIRLIPTAEVFAFGTGELRTGVRQDFAYARQNKVGWFAEEAIALTKYGCRPWFKINATLCDFNMYSGALNLNDDATLGLCTYVADNAGANEPDPFPET